MSLTASILVVDDDKGVRETLSELLETEGFMVVTAENGEQAVRAAKKQVFEVALIDIKLPDMDGLELLEKLKEGEVGYRMVKILITGFPTLKSAIEAVNREADGYVFKPIDAWKLLRIIRERLDKKTNEYIRTHAHNL
jgi:DNA-binding NtrC family response regulator